MYDFQLKEKLLAYAKSQGIDLIGFASKERFDGLDARYNPFSIFPEGETVILVGKRICRGSLRGVEEGTNFGDFRLYGNSWLNDEFLAIACYDITRQLEDDGYEAVPVYDNPPESFGMGDPVAPGKIAPNVAPDFDYAAVACGLCDISMTGQQLTKEFGTRQLFQMVITDAPLEPSGLLSESICDGCMKCADSCPLGAVSKTETLERTICGKTFTTAKIDYDICRKFCKNGCINGPFKGQKPNMKAALCNRTCLAHLENEQLVGNLFANSFRKREAWGMDIYGNNVKIEEV